MKSNLKNSLVLVIPAYNEADCIESVVLNWLHYLRSRLDTNTSLRLLLINDGSADATGEILNALAAKEKQITVIHQPNGGHGNAVINGYRSALLLQPDFVFQVDSDDQFMPEDFFKIWEKRDQSYFITGYRQQRHDDLNRIFVTRVLRILVGLVFQCYLKDSNVPYRLMRGSYLQMLLKQLPENPFAPNIFLAIMAKRDGQDLFEIPVGHKERKTGAVSIVKWRLLKVCFISAVELLQFRLRLPGKSNNQLHLNIANQ